MYMYNFMIMKQAEATHLRYRGKLGISGRHFDVSNSLTKGHQLATNRGGGIEVVPGIYQH